MRFFAGLLAYLVGIAVLLSIAGAGLMALQSPVNRTVVAPKALDAANKERPVDQVKPAVSAQKKTLPDRKGKAVHTAHKRLPAPPPTIGSDFAYGYAEEPRRRTDPNPLFIFGR